jgi:hypothetical protein
MTARHDLDGLPETYALALRLRDEGLDEAAIGRVLDIEPESVRPDVGVGVGRGLSSPRQAGRQPQRRHSGGQEQGEELSGHLPVIGAVAQRKRS